MNQEELLQLIEQAAEDERKTLDLSRKNLTQLPEEIGKLKNLTKLYLWNNQINEIPDAITDLENLIELNLSDNQISVIPSKIGELKNLTKLDLSANQISMIPSEISELKNLTRLALSDNQISVIPGEIAELKNLTRLYLWNNRISIIPSEIAELKNLIKLGLSDNQISVIPSAITELKNLAQLNLSDNQISVIPSEIAELKNLTELNFSENQICEIPNAITELKNLTKLYLWNNRISVIPNAIIQLENLEEINLKNNPIKHPPLKILTRGILAIQCYFLRQEVSRLSQELSGHEYDTESKNQETNTNTTVVISPIVKITSDRNKIFVSYSHQDNKWLEQFKKQIKPHVRLDELEVWDDTKIKTGSEWREEIEKALASAKVAVLLVSPNFIASDFIHNKELPPLLNAAKEKGLTIFWIPIRHSAYNRTELEKYQSAHPPTQPLESLPIPKRNKAWVSICEQIAEGMIQSE